MTQGNVAAPSRVVDDDCISDDTDEFASYLADFGAAYGEQDHRLFVDAFRNGAIPGLPASTPGRAETAASACISSSRRSRAWTPTRGSSA